MTRWTEQAQWVGPTPNQSGPMVEQRGMILHVMQGSLGGSIAWGKNPASSVSFHFGTSKAGACQQLVDTDITAWTQGSGNGHWISVENEDYSGNPLSDAQIEVVAQLYARGVRDYDWPYRLADSPSGSGLGWHGMGGAAWGGHYDCPGEPIKDQRDAILARAREINGGTPPPEEVTVQYLVQDERTIDWWLSDRIWRDNVGEAGPGSAVERIQKQGGVVTWPERVDIETEPGWGRDVDAGGGGSGGAHHHDVVTVTGPPQPL